MRNPTISYIIEGMTMKGIIIGVVVGSLMWVGILALVAKMWG